MSVVELNKEEIAYVDSIVQSIVVGDMTRNGTLNPDAFRGLVQAAYRAALISLEVRKEYVVVPVQPLSEESILHPITIQELVKQIPPPPSEIMEEVLAKVEETKAKVKAKVTAKVKPKKKSKTKKTKVKAKTKIKVENVTKIKVKPLGEVEATS